MKAKSLNPALKGLDIELDEYGRAIIEDKSILAEIAGAFGKYRHQPSLDDEDFGSNVGCSNTGC